MWTCAINRVYEKKPCLKKILYHWRSLNLKIIIFIPVKAENFENPLIILNPTRGIGFQIENDLKLKENSNFKGYWGKSINYKNRFLKEFISVD